MMGTEKIDRRSVCTVALSVLLSLLLALTPVLAVAEPANGGKCFCRCGGGHARRL